MLASTGELRFLLEDSTVSHKLLGAGSATLEGLFRLDISQLSPGNGTWNLVAVGTLTESFGGTFGLKFIDDTTFSTGDNITYTSGDWTFDTVSGNLTVVPEPSSFVLVGISALLFATVFRRKKR